MVCRWLCGYIHVHAQADRRSPEENTPLPTSSIDETGWTRVTTLWMRLITGELNYPDVNLIRNSFIAGGAAGLTYGSMIASRNVVQDFIRKHNDYTFKGEYEARRRLTDYISLQLLRMGWRVAWRLSLFSGALMLGTVSAITYRNDLYIRDFCATGALVGGLWKVKYGLKATVSGAVVAGTFGLMCGCLAKLYLLASGTKIPEYRAYLHDEYASARQRQNRKLIEEYNNEEFAQLLEHEKRLEKVKTDILWKEGFFEQQK